VPRYVEVEVSWQDGTSQKSYTLKTLALHVDKEEIGKEPDN
jgi:hypothetical protein